MVTLDIEASCGKKGCDAADGAKLDKYGNPLHPAFLQCRADEDFQHIMLNIVEAVGRVAYAADCKSV
jgi:hypothetical protein